MQSSNITFISYTWQNVLDMIDYLGQKIVKHKQTHDIKLYGIPNGGVVVASILASRYNFTLINEIKYADFIIDDVCDSGNTLQLINQPLINTGVLIFKERSNFVPTIHITTVADNHWVIFPWENEQKEIQRSNLYYAKSV